MLIQLIHNIRILRHHSILRLKNYLYFIGKLIRLFLYYEL